MKRGGEVVLLQIFRLQEQLSFGVAIKRTKLELACSGRDESGEPRGVYAADMGLADQIAYDPTQPSPAASRPY
ncbi:hypothetical protein B0G76_8002 [Paraburkholderia sp. BL23I1N1]|nr:hypothetical protein B0G76_8002 [Paraburkholderia sp. BL23I1N1]